MNTVILEARKDRETGELGYMVVGTKMIEYPMVSREGLLIAHDLLEHVNGVDSIGSIDDELEALGGVWYVRGEFSDLNRNSRVGSRNSPEENLAGDVLNLARIYNNGVNFRTPVPETEEHDEDISFESIIDIAKGQVEDEIDEEDRDAERLKQYFDAVLHYMRKGYDKAAAKYPNQCMVNDLFWAIAEACDPYVGSAEMKGQRLELSYNLTTGMAYCEEYYESEEDEYEDE